ncbi:phosphatase PAP2 family protein [Accumulibacter sp.]|uniref:phosphatase PAP2 family protein n=1 Tax=Accumulibacter sp. TaxID=2053492 RepID=UPI0028C48CE5|nr:phosphatase PAP2 family protein [Accumulibacter sp.]
MIAVPAIRRSNQLSAMLLGYLAFSAVYLGSGTLQLVAPTTLHGSTLDAAVPYLDWTVWVYLTQFILLPTAIVSARDDSDRSQTLYAMLLATLLAAPIFLAWPTVVLRPTPPDGFTGLAWRLLYLADTPANCFPSLHVALATIAGRALWRRGACALAVVWPSLIAVSTLTTRQHVAWDIAGGICCAAIALWLTKRIFRLDCTRPAHDAAGG